MSIKPESQLTLFNYKVIDVLMELNIDRATALLWNKNSYLSFDIEVKKEVSNPEYLELIFIHSLFKSGLSLTSIDQLLSKLVKPYAYNPTKVYFDFRDKQWKYIPERFELTNENYYEEMTSLLDEMDIEEERETLQSLLDYIKERLEE